MERKGFVRKSLNRILLFLSFLLLFVYFGERIDAEEVRIEKREGSVVLENPLFLCELSTVKGLRWSKIRNKQTGSDYLFKEANSPIFIIQGKKVSLDSQKFTIKEVRATEKEKRKSAQITLVSEKPPMEATIQIEIDETPKMVWSLNLKNLSESPLRVQPIFPVLARLNIDEDLSENYYFYPWRSGIVGKVDCEHIEEYGNLAWMQVMAIFHLKTGAGLYTYPKDNTGGFKGLVLKKLSPNSETIIRHSETPLQYEMPKEEIFDFDEGIGLAYYYPEKEVVSGREYLLPETVIGVYQGGWKEPLKDYANWAHTWYRHVETPQWFKNCFSFIIGHPPGFWSEKEQRYIYAENLKGWEHITQWAMWDDYPPDVDGRPPFTIDRYRPGDFDYNRHRGGLETFREEVKKCQAKGTRFTVYIDHRFCWAGSKIGEAHGKEWASMDRPNNYAQLGPYDPSGTGGWSECFYEPNAWADYIAQTCGRIVRETGMDGIYLDELMIGFPCYNHNHIHYQKDRFPYNPQLLIQNAIKAREAMRKENPQAILMTEHAGSDYYTQFFDGSWSQTYYAAGFPFAEKYYDEFSLNYFRFCFPEFKLAEWGESPDQVRRCFFNGIGRCGGFGGRIDQVLKENGDAFASLSPEPLIETKVKKVLANKFPIPEKTIYTIYNKSEKRIDQEVLEVEPREGYHYLELVSDQDIPYRLELSRMKDVLRLEMQPFEVLCVAQLPQIIQAIQEGSLIKISLRKPVPGATLYAFLDIDTSHAGFADAVKVELKDGKGELDVSRAFGHKGKLILKLFQGDLLVDELILIP